MFPPQAAISFRCSLPSRAVPIADGLPLTSTSSGGIGSLLARCAMRSHLQLFEILVSSPHFCQLDGRAHQLTGILLQLLFQRFQQSEAIGRRASEAANHLSIADDAHFARIWFVHRALPLRHLTIANDDHTATTPHRENRRAVQAVAGEANA